MDNFRVNPTTPKTAGNTRRMSGCGIKVSRYYAKCIAQIPSEGGRLLEEVKVYIATSLKRPCPAFNLDRYLTMLDEVFEGQYGRLSSNPIPIGET
jgi:hypothetical protein